MRNPLYSLLLAAAAATLLLGSCGLVGSDEKKKPTADSTYFRATLNGEETWNGNPDAAFSKQGRFNSWLVVFADSTHQSRPYRERLGFSITFHGTDEYSLVETEYEINETGVRIAGASFSENDGDVRLATYYATDAPSANQLTVTSYDSTSGMMEGTFRTTVVVDSAERVSEPGEPPRRYPPLYRREVPGESERPAGPVALRNVRDAFRSTLT